jgi:hypothetical protein
VIYAWYELVPAASQPVRLTIRAGDVISASVEVVGTKVTLALADKTSHASFTKTLSDRSIDVGSAEWIAEAPSECLTSTQCRTLPLANYGSAQFSGASAETTTGRTGAISGPLWQTTKIVLASAGTRFVSYGQPNVGGGVQSTPSALTSGGSAFSIIYSSSAGNQPTVGGGGLPLHNGGHGAARRGAVRGVSVGGHERLVEGVRTRAG